MERVKLHLYIILVVSICGVLFSGYLSYGELFGECEIGCTAGDEGRLLGVPVCVYGLVMYTIVLVNTALAILAFNKKKA